MNRFIFFIIIFFLPHTSFSQILTKDLGTYYAGEYTVATFIEHDPVNGGFYVIGITADTFNIATAGAHKNFLSGPPLNFWTPDVFIAKFDHTGTRLWGTYFGGSENDKVHDACVDKWGNLYITGYTQSVDEISSAGAFLETISLSSISNHSSFITKFSPDGTQLWSTYFGSAYNDKTWLKSIDTDIDGNVYVAGLTSIDGLATPGTYQESLVGDFDGIIAKFTPSGSLLWCTYYDEANINGLKISNNHFYIIGQTNSLLHSGTPGTYQPEPIMETSDGLPGVYSAYSSISRFTNNGEKEWMTFVSSYTDKGVEVYNLDTDNSGNVFLYGLTNSPAHIATEGAFLSELYGVGCDSSYFPYVSCYDYFLMKFDSTGNKVWGTYYGSEGDNTASYLLGSDVWVIRRHIKYSEPENKIYIGGSVKPTTTPDTRITTECTYSPSGEWRGIIAKFDANTGWLEWGTYVEDAVRGLEVSTTIEGNGDGYVVVGSDVYYSFRTGYEELSTPGAFQSSIPFGATYSGFIGRLTQKCEDRILTIAFNEGIFSASDGFLSYHWYHNGTLIHESTDSFFVYEGSLLDGDYYVIADSDCNCDYTSDTLSHSTAINPIDNNLSIAIYPNPVTNLLQIEFNKLDYNEVSLIITDLLGRNHYHSVIKDTKKHSIDVSNFPSGIYFIKLSTPSGNYIHKFSKL